MCGSYSILQLLSVSDHPHEFPVVCNVYYKASTLRIRKPGQITRKGHLGAAALSPLGACHSATASTSIRIAATSSSGMRAASDTCTLRSLILVERQNLDQSRKEGARQRRSRSHITNWYTFSIAAAWVSGKSRKRTSSASYN